MDKVIKLVAPNMPTDRHVAQTRDVSAWYKVVFATKTLMVPPLQVLKVNMLELERFSEAVKSFETCDLEHSMYKWDDQSLVLTEATGLNIVKVLQDLPRRAKEHGGIMACDIETRRLEWEDNLLLSIGIAYGPSHCVALWNIPIKGAKQDTEMGSSQEVLDALQTVFSQPDITYVWHNGKFDCTRLKYLANIDARVDDDTMLMHYCCINEKQGTHGLKDLGQLYLQAPQWDAELDNIKRTWCSQHKVPLKEFMYDCIPTQTLIPYMQRDCVATYRLLLRFRELARPEAKFIYSQLCRASNVYGSVELTGQKIDLEYLEDLEVDLDRLIEHSNHRLSSLANQYWNPELYKSCTGAKTAPATFSAQSPKQLKWMLETVLQHPVPATDATTLQNLLEDLELQGINASPGAHEFVEAVLDTRKYSKYLETYVLGIRNVLCRDSRVRCTFNLHGTETGRLSSSKPNMQNIPRNKIIKNLIVASKGKCLLQLDYSQAELRVLAMLSKDPTLIGIYVSGQDLHDAVCDMMFGPGSHKDKELRNLAKTINFGIAYGRGAGSIAMKFGKTMSEAQAIIDKWFAPMPKVKEFINERRRMANKGEKCVTVLGRERHFIMTDSERNHIQNEYINTPVQGTASDFTLLSLLEIHDYLETHWQGKASITTTVHDSIIIEVDDEPSILKDIASRCLEIMAHTPLKYCPDCPVPFVADAEVGYKWGEMNKLDVTTGLIKKKEEEEETE